MYHVLPPVVTYRSWHVYFSSSVVSLWRLICWQVVRYVLYVLVNFRAQITLQWRTSKRTQIWRRRVEFFWRGKCCWWGCVRCCSWAQQVYCSCWFDRKSWRSSWLGWTPRCRCCPRAAGCRQESWLWSLQRLQSWRSSNAAEETRREKQHKAKTRRKCWCWWRTPWFL